MAPVERLAPTSSTKFHQVVVGARMISHPWKVNDDELNETSDEATAVAGQLSPLDKLGSALVKQLMKVVDEGVGPITGSRDYAEARLAHFGDPEKAIKRIVAETTASSATAGFVTGLGGFITLPVTLPANITGQAILNARMVGAIAHLRGWDLQDELVRNSVLITIAGGTPNAVLTEFGVTVARKSAEAAIKKLPVTIVREINKRVGFMLVAKYGTKRSVVTLSKLVPGIGGVVGGAVDATFTGLVGRLAKKSFTAQALAVDVAG
ncbi:MAG TPA: EcsC family protein [Trebonia sp.]|nr:EcsC family protein [Trebonia sp.]